MCIKYDRPLFFACIRIVVRLVTKECKLIIVWRVSDLQIHLGYVGLFSFLFISFPFFLFCPRPHHNQNHTYHHFNRIISLTAQ